LAEQNQANLAQSKQSAAAGRLGLFCYKQNKANEPAKNQITTTAAIMQQRQITGGAAAKTKPLRARLGAGRVLYWGH
jgi:hypothetical protein